MNQNQLYQLGIKILKKANIEEAEIKAKRLIEFVLKQTRQEFIKNSLLEVFYLQEQEYRNLLEEIIQGKPLQYITNCQEFMGLKFYVDENVLIPQPDTEVLVEQAIEIIKKSEKKCLYNADNLEETRINDEKSPMKILDLCTGSGAIAISIQKYIHEMLSDRISEQNKIKTTTFFENMCDIDIIASDISMKALKIAKKNATQNNIENKIQFIQSDMFSNLNNYRFDIIVSNPPYIETEVISTLSKEVQQEPSIALDGGEDGLRFYRIILEQVEKYLKPNGYVLFEIGYDQGDKILELWRNLQRIGKCNLNIVTQKPIKDLAGNDRVMIFANFKKMSYYLNM